MGARSRMAHWAMAALAAFVLCLAGDCHTASAQAVALTGEDTFAEMRTIKGEVSVTPQGEAARAPYPRERIAEGETATLAAGGLAWLRRDAGAVLLVAGPTKLV